MKYQLIYPLAIYAFYMVFLTFYMFSARLRALKNREVSYKYFQTFMGEPPKDRSFIIARHYNNQFEVPMLFYATCAIFMALNLASYYTLVLAWLFVVSRLIHAWIHLGKNKLEHRVVAFGTGWVVILLLWIQLLMAAMGAAT